MDRLKATYPRIKSLVTWTGFLLLLAHCATAPVSVQLVWSMAYPALSVIVFPLLYAFIFIPAVRHFRKARCNPAPDPNDEAIVSGTAVHSYVQSNPLRLLLAAGE